MVAATTSTAAPTGCSRASSRATASTFTYVDARDPAERRGRAASRARAWSGWRRRPTRCCSSWTSPPSAELPHERGALLAVDNTFASPYFQRPLELGADIVVHSTTKYLGGHSDVVGGAVVDDDEAIYERPRSSIQNAVGGVPGPFDAWLVLRGIKTLAVRMREHERNARAVARVPGGRTRRVERVHYPGLPTHPQHELARRQMRGFGGMISFASRAAGRARASACCAARACSRWPRAWAASSRSIEPPGDHDPRLHPGRASASAAASPTAWCASRSASRTRTTCWRICGRRWRHGVRANFAGEKLRQSGADKMPRNPLQCPYRLPERSLVSLLAISTSLTIRGAELGRQAGKETRMHILFEEESAATVEELLAQEHETAGWDSVPAVIGDVIRALRDEIRQHVADEAMARRMEHRLLLLESLTTAQAGGSTLWGTAPRG